MRCLISAEALREDSLRHVDSGGRAKAGGRAAGGGRGGARAEATEQPRATSDALRTGAPHAEPLVAPLRES